MKSFLKTISINVIIATFSIMIPLNAGSLNPSAGPGDTMKTLDDIYCAFQGCTPGYFALNSTTTPGATMRTLQEVYDIAGPAVDYTKQSHQIYDDYNCANNNSESNTACGAGDAEFTGEEAVWSSSTDTNLSGALVASGKVYKDTRTGLYWADAYDAVSGAGTPDTLTNSFTIGTGCTDTDINNGACDSSMFQTKGNAVQYCLDLSLDATDDGNDETDWRLPTQKELIQASIDGAGNNLPNITQNYWSSTEYYINSTFAWYFGLNIGYSTVSGKSNGYYVRCVR